MTRETGPDDRKQTITDQQLQQIQRLAQTVQYGSITLVFQDGVLVQIDKNEKIRMGKCSQGLKKESSQN